MVYVYQRYCDVVKLGSQKSQCKQNDNSRMLDVDVSSNDLATLLPTAQFCNLNYAIVIKAPLSKLMKLIRKSIKAISAIFNPTMPTYCTAFLAIKAG